MSNLTKSARSTLLTFVSFFVLSVLSGLYVHTMYSLGTIFIPPILISFFFTVLYWRRYRKARRQELQTIQLVCFLDLE